LILLLLNSETPSDYS